MTEKPVLLATGASSGIGEAVARLFARQGYRVVLAARRMDRLENLAHEIESAGGEALPFQADLSQAGEVERLVRASLEHFGQIDVLFNNAGFGRMNWLENLDPEKDIAAQIQLNLTALIQMTRAVLPAMIARRQGHIINMASIAGLVATPTYSVYAATKYGVRGFTEALRREVGVYNIHVSGIYPGGVETEFSQHTGVKRKTGVSMPKFMRLQAEDVARAVWSLERRPRRMLVFPWPMKLGVWANALLPGLADWLMETRFVRPERLG